MTESIPVRCPACRREHAYSAPVYPCACGAPVAPALDASTPPAVVTHPVWEETWVAVRCLGCGRRSQWPRPELGCPCGAVLRIPVSAADRPETGTAGKGIGATDGALLTVRSAVTAVALFLHGLGHRDLRRAGERPPSGIGLTARGLVAHLDPGARPASVREVECLWLAAMAESARCAHFSLAGYDEEAHARAEDLLVPLFVLEPTGAPRPVNGHAEQLAAPLA